MVTTTRQEDRPLVRLVLPRWGGQTVQTGYTHRPLVLFVLGALARREGWRVELVDENHRGLPDTPADLVMVSAWTKTAPRAYVIADHYRAQGVPVVMGGVHPSLLPGEALRHADAVVCGESESIMGDLLADALAGTLRPVYQGEWQGMEGVPAIDEYADLYAVPPYNRVPVHFMQTTRGCRFNCGFCSVIRINGRGSRHREPERVVDEIRRLATLPPRLPGGPAVFFVDDDLAADIDYAGELLETIASSGLKASLSVQASIGIARHPDVLRAAHAAGLRSIFCGFESGSRESLVEANKKNRPNEFAELISRVHAHRIAVTGGFIFGFDHDEPDVFEQTVEFAHGIGVDAAHFSLLTPYPGTSTFATFYEQDRIVDFNWGRYDLYSAVFEPERMRRDQLEAGVRWAYRAFYGPRVMARRGWRGARTRLHLRQMLGLGATNASYLVQSRRRPGGLPPDYEAPREELERLLLTSQAPAAEAISTAVTQLDGTAERAVPVALGAPR